MLFYCKRLRVFFPTLREGRWRAPSYLVTKLSTSQHRPNSHQTSCWKDQIRVSIFKSRAVDPVSDCLKFPLLSKAVNRVGWKRFEAGRERCIAVQCSRGGSVEWARQGVSGLPLCSQWRASKLQLVCSKKIFTKSLLLVPFWWIWTQYQRIILLNKDVLRRGYAPLHDNFWGLFDCCFCCVHDMSCPHFHWWKLKKWSEEL